MRVDRRDIATLVPYDDVREVLALLCHGARDVLGGNLVGVYLTGSLTYGGFDRGSSDIDFLAVVEQPVSLEQRGGLVALHERIGRRQPPWATRLEGSYLPRHLLDRTEPPAEPRPYVNDGRLWDPDPRYGREWTMNRFPLHRCGIALVGPDAADLFPPVTMEEMRTASLRSFHEEWEPLLDDPSRLDDPHHQAYITLTLCRILHTTYVDGIASKPVAAQWVARTYGEPWSTLVRQAAQWRHGRQLDVAPQVLAFVGFVRDQLGGRPP